ncbi:hypothetical protein BDV30DRAFT_192601 [Aspergillus minisclerotigenes]|uniref:Uncharacterized protein n=1 Tax=Aspergillus minisclerotigenes TaxID=656917 RepID=A0A5N6JES1_9EURO|nr:hypothetical protein BDV30DRAFT_192601 [Aspergillus minisclerotigenes]
MAITVDGKEFGERDLLLAQRCTFAHRANGSNDDVKGFDGGRTSAERDLFANDTVDYEELVEVKAFYEGRRWETGTGQEYRFIRKGLPNKGDVCMGSARRTEGNNDFDAFFPFEILSEHNGVQLDGQGSCSTLWYITAGYLVGEGDLGSPASYLYIDEMNCPHCPCGALRRRGPVEL